MGTQSDHGRLITDAAEAALLPIGCRRKGQSRTWYTDEGYWGIWIEFQPSGWSKGSYLNIGVIWLWRPKPSVAFSYRPAEFISYESKTQFAPLVERMAGQAAQEVQALRVKLLSFESVLDFIKSRATRDGWPIYDAAIACALAGKVSAAQEFFNRIQAWQTDGYEWQLELKSEAEALSGLLNQPSKFRSTILATIERNRKLMRFSVDARCLDELDSIVVQ